jgi:hypothetical protein
MADVDLKPMDPGLLPPIAHAAAEDVPPPDPCTFQAVSNLEDLIRPDHGLWCAPVTAWSSDGAPTRTTWTDWCATPDEVTGQPSEHHGRYTKLTRVKPLPQARIYLIETADDLDQLVATFPLPPGHLMRRSAPDWEAMAAADWDAVYVSGAGLTANGTRVPMVEPALGRWDCPSILWLRPAYRLTTP